MPKVLVVGAGVAGAVIARTLEAAGHEVLAFDAGLPNPGTAASAGLIHDAWSPLSKEDTKAALALLDELFGLRRVTMRVHGMAGKFVKEVVVHACPPERTALKLVNKRNVVKVGSNWLHATAPETETKVHGGSRVGLETYAGKVVVAAGHWTGKLLGKPDLVTAKAGVSFRYPLQEGDAAASFIRPWAPYKQIVGYDVRPGREFWAGDGSALKPESMTLDRVTVSRNRVREALPFGFPEPNRTVVGLRPVVKGDALGTVGEVMPGCFVATGGAKGGTLLAAHHALWLRQYLSYVPSARRR